MWLEGRHHASLVNIGISVRCMTISAAASTAARRTNCRINVPKLNRALVLTPNQLTPRLYAATRSTHTQLGTAGMNNESDTPQKTYISAGSSR